MLKILILYIEHPQSHVGIIANSVHCAISLAGAQEPSQTEENEAVQILIYIHILIFMVFFSTLVCILNHHHEEEYFCTYGALKFHHQRHSFYAWWIFVVLPIHQTYGHHPIQSKYLKKKQSRKSGQRCALGKT